jgi:hypothetical protein
LLVALRAKVAHLVTPSLLRDEREQAYLLSAPAACTEARLGDAEFAKYGPEGSQGVLLSQGVRQSDDLV